MRIKQPHPNAFRVVQHGGWVQQAQAQNTRFTHKLFTQRSHMRHGVLILAVSSSADGKMRVYILKTIGYIIEFGLYRPLMHACMHSHARAGA